MATLAYDQLPADGLLQGENPLANYQHGNNDEMLSVSSDGVFARPGTEDLIRQLAGMTVGQLHDLQLSVNAEIRRSDITFTVHDGGENVHQPWPLDAIPRIIAANEWQNIENGLIQRLKALNCFIADIYDQQEIVIDGIVPNYLISAPWKFLTHCIGVKPAYNTWAHINGCDLVRDASGTYRVLADNLGMHSGVSYLLENRRIMKKIAPEFFAAGNVASVDHYTTDLKLMLQALSPNNTANIAVLTPGISNSAYFEHAYLAREMGVLLVEGRDLVVSDRDGFVYADTIDGPTRVDVIYRRVEDDLLDPECFNPHSTMGVNGLMQAWAENRVGMANAPGTGVADNKVICSYVPDMIKYYLNESPLLPNVDTYRCSDDHGLAFVLDHMQDLVVKPASESGGHGLLIGPDSTLEERKHFYRLINDMPRNYIAQPIVQLSTCPTVTGMGLAARHVDLRPYVLQGETASVTTGGLTRVALQQGSLNVNASQGGGSKDTWVVTC